MLSEAFNPFGVVVDWLGACKAGRLDDLLDIYEVSASLRCSCCGQPVYRGRDDLGRYWSTRLERAVPQAFDLVDIAPGDSGDELSAELDYVGFDGKPVSAHFQFTTTGKIAEMICRPAPMYLARRRKAASG